MTSGPSPAEKHSRPSELSMPHPQDEDCESSTLTDSVHALAVPNALPGQEQRDGSAFGPVGLSFPGSTDENKAIIITAVRATDLAPGLGPLPVEFYMVLHHNDLEWRTENKHFSANNDVEWTGPIPLPSDLSATICFEVYAISESQPASGDGEQLQSVTTTVEELLDRSAKAMAFRLFPKDGDVAFPCPSILVTIKQQKSEDSDRLALRVDRPQWSAPESREGIKGTTNQSHSLLGQSGGQSSTKQDSTPCPVDEDPQAFSAWLLQQFERYGDLAKLQQAITILEGLVNTMSIEGDEYCRALGKLGVALRFRFERLGQLNDLEDAISRLNEAVELTPRDHPEKPGRLDNLGVVYHMRFQRLGQLSDLEDAISRQRVAVELVPRDHLDKPGHLSNLGISYRARFERLGQLNDIENAISSLKEAVDLTPHDNLWRPAYLSNLGISYRIRFKRLGLSNDLEVAILRLREAVDLTPRGHPYKVRHLNNLGYAYQTRFRCAGESSDLEEAISTLKKAVHLTPPSHPEKPRYLSNLGNSFQTRFERFGELSDLEDAISMLREAVDLTPPGHPDKPGHLNNLGTCYQTRFERQGEFRDLEDALSRLREAVDLTPPGHPDRSSRLNNLGNSHYTRSRCVGELSDLEDAISMLREAVDLTPPDHPDKFSRLNNLGTFYQTRFEQLGECSDLEDAILMLKKVVDFIPRGDPHKPRYLNNLANSYLIRFERFGELSDLDRAILKLKEAIDLTPPNHPDRPGHLSNLGVSHRTRFEYFGELRDLEDALLRLREAVDLTPPGHPNKPDRLNNLGNSYHTRFLRLEEPSDLEDAILMLREAVNLTPPGHPEKPSRLNNLGHSYHSRFVHLGELRDLEEASLKLREAVDLTHRGHPLKPMRLNNLSNSYHTRFEKLGELNDLEDAILILREAIDLTPPGHPDTPGLLNNLGTCYQTRFEHLEQLRDLEDAISRLREAVDLTPPDHLEKPRRLSNLGVSYQTRFQHLGQLGDFENAISSLREAVELTPHGHPNKPVLLKNLGTSYRIRFQRLGKLGDLEYAIALYSYAASGPVGSINIRLSALDAWIACARHIRHHSLLQAYSIVVTLIPRLAWIGQSLLHRYDKLIMVTDFIREAAAAALEEGFPERAVEWLEQGRSIIWGELFQLRSSYEELSSAHPDYARRLRELSTQLDQASATHEQSLSVLSEQKQGVTHPTPESLQQVADRHRALAIERDKLLQKIRRLPGFERFLLRKKFSQLRASAHSGPVVILNVAETRCDALILVANLDHVIHIPLPSFTAKGSIHLQNTMKYFVRHTRDGKIAPLKGISWESILPPLWKTVVKPVLDALAFSVVREDLSRIFWCPTGPLAFLPIHAAGLYNRQYSTPGNKVFDFVVSSYVPTLAILAPSLNPDPAVAASNDLRMLTVGQPSSDGQSPLPGVATELVHIKDAVEDSPSAQTVLVESSVGTVEEVLTLMKETDWVHFACHGIQDGINSGLCLADRRRLKLRDMVRLSRPRGGLAFLSACQTATGEKKLSDEAIHMAAGMLFAGYGGVIGTMWSISDNIAPRVARDVYGQLLKKGKRPDYREAARALQDAIEGLRNTEVPFTEWIPFIHVGL